VWIHRIVQVENVVADVMTKAFDELLQEKLAVNVTKFGDA